VQNVNWPAGGPAGIVPGMTFPASPAVQPATRRLLAAFAVLTLLAAHQLLVLPDRTDRWFAWTVQSRPTAAFLGAAYAAGFVLSVAALRRRTWAEARIPVAAVGVFAALTLAATLLHAHRLHLTAEDPVAQSAAWFWLAVYLVVPAACLAVVARQGGLGQGGLRSARGPVRRPIPPWLRRLLTAQGLVLLVAGTTLLVRGAMTHHPQHDVGGFWPWPVGPLGAQVIGAWLVAFAVAAALVLRERDLGRLTAPALGYAAFGAFQLGVLVAQRSEVQADAASVWAYGTVLATAVAAGGYGWWAGRRPARSPRSDQIPYSSRTAASCRPSPRALAAVTAAGDSRGCTSWSRSRARCRKLAVSRNSAEPVAASSSAASSQSSSQAAA
jgi:hypothetical protein